MCEAPRYSVERRATYTKVYLCNAPPHQPSALSAAARRWRDVRAGSTPRQSRAPCTSAVCSKWFLITPVSSYPKQSVRVIARPSSCDELPRPTDRPARAAHGLSLTRVGSMTPGPPRHHLISKQLATHPRRGLKEGARGVHRAGVRSHLGIWVKP